MKDLGLGGRRRDVRVSGKSRYPYPCTRTRTPHTKSPPRHMVLPPLIRPGHLRYPGSTVRRGYGRFRRVWFGLEGRRGGPAAPPLTKHRPLRGRQREGPDGGRCRRRGGVRYTRDQGGPLPTNNICRRKEETRVERLTGKPSTNGENPRDGEPSSRRGRGELG